MRRSLFAALLLAAGCSQILGLEDRDLVPSNVNMDGGNPLLDAGPDGQAEAAVAAPGCNTYCSESEALCPAGPEKVGVSAFDLPAQCKAVCPLYPPGDATNNTGNTLACRLKLLANARQFGEASTICQSISPIGGSFKGLTESCGTSCENFCSLRAKICGDAQTVDQCLTRCAAIPDPQENPYNADVDFVSGQDSFNCRIAHLVVAGTYLAAGDLSNRNEHCKHSGVNSSSQCNLSDKDAPKCADYCKIVTTGCTGDNRVYTDAAQCQAYCDKAPIPNAGGDSVVGDTVRCRLKAGYEALTDVAVTARTCETAGPISVDCGGSKCEPFCTSLLKACPGGRFATMADCMTNCDSIPDSRANVPVLIKAAVTPDGVSNKTLSCRMYSLMEVISKNDARQCANASGVGTECKD